MYTVIVRDKDGGKKKMFNSLEVARKYIHSLDDNKWAGCSTPAYIKEVNEYNRCATSLMNIPCDYDDIPKWYPVKCELLFGRKVEYIVDGTLEEIEDLMLDDRLNVDRYRLFVNGKFQVEDDIYYTI